MLKHLSISIFGRVQGVFFRRTVKHEALRRGLSGFVANEDDGSVRIEIEGPEQELHEFDAWIKAGAGDGMHQIGEVDTEEGAFKGLEGFEIQD